MRTVCLADLPGWVFVDWANLNTKGQSTAVNAQAYDALRHAAKIARTLGYPERGEAMATAGERPRRRLNDLMWDRDAGLIGKALQKGCASRPSASRPMCCARWPASRMGGSVTASWRSPFSTPRCCLQRKTERNLKTLPDCNMTFPQQRPTFPFIYLRLLYANGRTPASAGLYPPAVGRDARRGRDHLLGAVAAALESVPCLERGANP